jgi:phosphatidylglycerophosphate synthase
MLFKHPKFFPVYQVAWLDLALNTLLTTLVGFGLVCIVALISQQLFALPISFVIQTVGTFAVIGTLLFFGLSRHLPQRRFGAANSVTLLRAGLIALLAGLIGYRQGDLIESWTPIFIALIALLLDGVDGWLARRENSASPFGARFDMEMDALFTLVLAVLVFQAGKVHGWVLLLGAMRYLFVSAGFILPWLRRPLPAKKWRQTVCVIQASVLIACLAPTTLSGFANGLTAIALVLLSLSFGMDTVWLKRQSKYQAFSNRTRVGKLAPRLSISK